jgi:hypothetical protein
MSELAFAKRPSAIRQHHTAILGAVAALSLAIPLSTLHAQAPAKVPELKPETEFVASRPTPKVEALRGEGWAYALTLAANLNVASNREVVGQVNGNSLLFGASVLSGISYRRAKHEWVNTGTLNEAWSRTPALDAFNKSNDVLELQSLYNFFVTELTGPFARVSMQTSLFKTDRLTSADQAYVRDTDPTDTETTDSFRLSDSMQPLTFTESAGWFLQPLREKNINAYARAGFGGRHTLADGARSVTGDANGPVVQYTVLSDVHQAGAELFMGIDGNEVGGRLLYNAGLSALFPLITNDKTDRNVLELTKVALTGAVGVGVFSWLGINYQLKVIRDPQLVDAVQVQNALLLSIQYTLTSAPPVTAEPAPLSPEAQARIADLEARASAAEQRAAAAEAQLSAPTAPVAPAVEPVEPATTEPVAPVPAPSN